MAVPAHYTKRYPHHSLSRELNMAHINRGKTLSMIQMFCNSLLWFSRLSDNNRIFVIEKRLCEIGLLEPCFGSRGSEWWGLFGVMRRYRRVLYYFLPLKQSNLLNVTWCTWNNEWCLILTFLCCGHSKIRNTSCRQQPEIDPVNSLKKEK